MMESKKPHESNIVNERTVYCLWNGRVSVCFSASSSRLPFCTHWQHTIHVVHYRQFNEIVLVSALCQSTRVIYIWKLFELKLIAISVLITRQRVATCNHKLVPTNQFWEKLDHNILIRVVYIKTQKIGTCSIMLVQIIVERQHRLTLKLEFLV